MAQYLDACMQEAGSDATFLAKALGIIARAKGMSQLSRDTGLGPESLYKALSGEGNPSFATILKVTNALGIRLHAQAAQRVSSDKFSVACTNMCVLWTRSIGPT